MTLTTPDTTAVVASSSRPDVSTAVEPIIAGFHPDPSICRVGDDYYLANSSFEYAPAVPIWRSTDLIHWEQIGNALDREELFAAGHAAPSKGIFAPTLRHHDGRFWLITTDVSGGGGQIVVSAERAEGPWGDPVRIPALRGIDPDVAWDDDGTCFVTYCSTGGGAGAILQAPVDLATGEVLREPMPLWQGIGLAFPEAPHLYQRDGWWYLLIAEGGTERGHAVSIARSRRIDGPFAGGPGNPILSHRSLSHPVQNTGHADLIREPDGRWSMVYLGVRPRGVTPMFHVNGRETFLAGIEWVDGWPRVDEHRHVRPRPVHAFALETGFPLHPRWVSPGSAIESFASPVPGGLELTAAEGPGSSAAALVTRTLDPRWSASLALDVRSGDAGILVRLDDRHWFETRVADGSVHAVLRIGPVEKRVGRTLQHPAGRVTVTARALDPTSEGPDDLGFFIGEADDEHLLARVDGRYLSTEVAGGFTGRVVGVRALNGRVTVSRFAYEADDSEV